MDDSNFISKYEQGWTMANEDILRYGNEMNILTHAFATIQSGNYSIDYLRYYLTIIKTLFIELINNFKKDEKEEMLIRLKEVTEELVKRERMLRIMNKYDMQQKLSDVHEKLVLIHIKIVEVKERSGLGLTRNKFVNLNTKLKNLSGI